MGASSCSSSTARPLARPGELVQRRAARLAPRERGARVAEPVRLLDKDADEVGRRVVRGGAGQALVAAACRLHARRGGRTVQMDSQATCRSAAQLRTAGRGGARQACGVERGPPDGLELVALVVSRRSPLSAQSVPGAMPRPSSCTPSWWRIPSHGAPRASAWRSSSMKTWLRTRNESPDARLPARSSGCASAPAVRSPAVRSPLAERADSTSRASVSTRSKSGAVQPDRSASHALATSLAPSISASAFTWCTTAHAPSTSAAPRAVALPRGMAARASRTRSRAAPRGRRRTASTRRRHSRSTCRPGCWPARAQTPPARGPCRGTHPRRTRDTERGLRSPGWRSGSRPCSRSPLLAGER